MDAKQLGTFIADRRKSLGMTQALLAKKLHVTDKAVSRWERGVGFPDIHCLEPLATALQVSLLELVQTRLNDEDRISANDAEKLLADTIYLSQSAEKRQLNAGTKILIAFALISFLLLILLLLDGTIVLFSVTSLISGLLAWGIPIHQLSSPRTKFPALSVTASSACAFLSLTVQFFDLAHHAHSGDWSAIGDTIDVLIVVVILFSLITLTLNLIMVYVSKNRS